MTNVRMSMEKKLEGIRHAWPLWVGVITKAVVERYGDEGKTVIKDALRNQGQIQGRKAYVEKMHVAPTLRGLVEEILPRAIMEPMGEEMEITELSEWRCVMRMTRCPLQERWKIVKAPEDMCDIWDNYNWGFRLALNPTNPVIHHHRKQLYKGDPYCEIVWEIRGGPEGQVKGREEDLKAASIPMSTEEKLQTVRRAWPLWVGIITKAVVERYGDEGQTLIKDALRSQGQIHGERVFVGKRHMKSTLRGFIEGYMPVALETLGFEYEITELSESRCTTHVSRCPLQERWKIIKAPEDMCDIWDSYQLGVRLALNPTNPIVHYHRKQLFKGDPYCEIVWEIKEA